MVGPDLESNYLTLLSIVFLNECFEKVNFEKKSQQMTTKA